MNVGDKVRNVWAEDLFIPPGDAGVVGKVFDGGHIRVDYACGRARHYDPKEDEGRLYSPLPSPEPEGSQVHVAPTTPNIHESASIGPEEFLKALESVHRVHHKTLRELAKR